MDKTLELGTRTALPDDLLYLARQHRRDAWYDQPGLAGTGEIWLEHHKHFRAITMKIYEQLTSLREEGETTYDSGPSLHRHIHSLLRSLEGHHRIEDTHYFPQLQRIEPRLIQGFEILESDHHIIHDAIDELGVCTQDSLRRLGQTEGVMTSDQRFAVDKLARAVERIGPLLKQHLSDEEDIVIPIILERARGDPDFGA